MATEATVFRNSTMVLIGGRAAAYLIAFAIPMVLVRFLSPAEFGTYKQLFLVFGTLYLVLQFGMSESLYYFLPEHPERQAGYLFQTLLFLGILGAAAAGILSLAAPMIVDAMGNAGLEGLFPILGIFLALMLVAYPFDAILIVQRRVKSAAVLMAASEGFKSLMIISAILWLGDLKSLLWGVVFFAVVRVAFMVGFLVKSGFFKSREANKSLSILDRGLFRKQWGYAFPFGLAAGAFLLQSSLDQYIVAMLYVPSLFAIYAVGLFQIPVIEMVGTVTASNFMVEMSGLKREKKIDEIRHLWSKVVGFLALLAFPTFVFCFTMAVPLITVLFTDQYLESVPIFRVSVFAVLFAPLLTDAVLRVYGDTKEILKVGVIRLILSAALLPVAIKFAGLPGAAAVGIGVGLTAKLMMLHRVSRRIECGWRDLLPWSILARNAAAAILATLPLHWVGEEVNGSALATLVASAAVYGPLYLLGLIVFGVWPERRGSDHQTWIESLPVVGAKK